MQIVFKEKLSDDDLFRTVLDVILTETLTWHMGVHMPGTRKCTITNFWTEAKHMSADFQQRLFMVLRSDRLMELIDMQQYQATGHYKVRRDKLRTAANLCSKHWPVRLPEEGMIPATIDSQGVVHTRVDGEPAAEIDTEMDMDGIDLQYGKAVWGFVGLLVAGLAYVLIKL